MLETYIKLIFLAGLSFACFGLITYIKNRHSKISILFGLLSFSFALWSFSWFMMLISDGAHATVLFWARLLNLGATLIPVFYLHWIFHLLNKDKDRRFILLIGYTITALFAFASFTTPYIPSVHSYLFFPNWPTPGPLYTAFLFFGYFGMAGHGIVSIIREFNTLPQESKYQMVYVLLGSLLGFGGGAVNFLGMYGITVFQPFLIFAGAFGVITSPFFLAYAAFRYRFMDIKLIATEFFTGILLLVLLIDLLLAESFRDIGLKSVMLVLASIFGYLIIRSIINEVHSREKIEQLAEKLQHANKELDRINQAKSDFLSMASHQLKTPLSIIKGYISMTLEGSFGNITKKIKEQLEKVFISNERLISLVEDLLNLSRVEEGRMKYDWADENISNIVQQIMDEVIMAAQHKNLKIVWNPPSEPFYARVDINKIRNVIFNLVDNAIKYTNQGTITVAVSKHNQSVRVSVKDTGRGMSSDQIPKLFTKFTRVFEGEQSNLTTSGFGLGLYVARLIAEGHKGRVWAESAGLGKGSTFILEVPVIDLKHET